MVQAILLQEEKMQSSLVKSEIIEGEVVDTKVRDLEPMVVTAAIQFVIPANNIEVDVHNMMESFSERICLEIKNHKHRPVVPIQRYAKTAHAAIFLDVDKTFLTQRQGSTFIEGIHYFKPNDSSILRWDLEKLEEWMKSSSVEESHDDILDKMFA